MIRQDYILRMIEQAAQMIAQLIKLRADGDQSMAARLEREGAGRFLQLDPEDLCAWDESRIFRHLRDKGVPIEFPLRLGFALALLRERADAMDRQGRTDQAANVLSKAVGLLARAGIEAVHADVPSFAPGLADLLQRIPPDRLPSETVVLLVCYFEHAGRFAEAEDALFQLQEITGPGAEVRRLGDSFYQRLRRMSDERLAAGNLPREEVEQGAEQWRKLFV